MDLFQEVFQKPKVEEGKKFLGLLNQKHLQYLEGILETDLGAHKRRKRPFIGYFFGKWLLICLLTTVEHDETLKVDVSLCDKKGCKFNFQQTSYAFYDRRRRGFYLYQLPRDLIKDFYFCGYCKDLHHIDKLGLWQVRGYGS